MRWVFQLRLSETFVVVDNSVTDELDLRDTRDRLEVGMQDRFLRALCFVIAVTIILGFRIKGLERWSALPRGTYR